MDSALTFSITISYVALIVLYSLYKGKNNKPKGALLGCKKTGLFVGLCSLVGWVSAMFSSSTYGMAIIPRATNLVNFNYSLGLMLVIGIPIYSYSSTHHNKE
jgi:hypothetical protein